MPKIKSAISWILLIIVVIVGLIVGRSIWISLKDTRAELARQKEKMSQLTRADSLMRAYADSLDKVLLSLRQKEDSLLAEREQLKDKLKKLQIEYENTMARLDTVWQAGSVIKELDAAFPHWKGQIREAMRSDGVHALIAPRFFGADVAETKARLDKSLREIGLKDSTIANLDSTLTIKSEEVKVLSLKADSLKKTYDNLWTEYQGLDEKYRKLLVRKWFTLHFGPGNLLSAGVGAAAGYGVAYLRYKD